MTRRQISWGLLGWVWFSMECKSCGHPVTEHDANFPAMPCRALGCLTAPRKRRCRGLRWDW